MPQSVQRFLRHPPPFPILIHSIPPSPFFKWSPDTENSVVVPPTTRPRPEYITEVGADLCAQFMSLGNKNLLSTDKQAVLK